MNKNHSFFISPLVVCLILATIVAIGVSILRSTPVSAYSGPAQCKTPTFQGDVVENCPEKESSVTPDGGFAADTCYVLDLNKGKYQVIPCDNPGFPDAETSAPVITGECGSDKVFVTISPGNDPGVQPVDTDNDGVQDGFCIEKADAIMTYLKAIVNTIAGIIGIVAVGSLVFAGIQYITSSGDPQGLAAARSRISHVIIALIMFIFLYAFANFLVPGGLL